MTTCTCIKFWTETTFSTNYWLQTWRHPMNFFLIWWLNIISSNINRGLSLLVSVAENHSISRCTAGWSITITEDTILYCRECIEVVTLMWFIVSVCLQLAVDHFWNCISSICISIRMLLVYFSWALIIIVSSLITFRVSFPYWFIHFISLNHNCWHPRHYLCLTATLIYKGYIIH